MEFYVSIEQSWRSLMKRKGNIIWFSTTRCPLNCTFCNSRTLKYVSKEEELKTDEWIRIFKSIDELMDIQEIVVTGGEPGLLSDMSKILRSVEWPVHLNTNLMVHPSEWLDDDIIDRIPHLSMCLHHHPDTKQAEEFFKRAEYIRDRLPVSTYASTSWIHTQSDPPDIIDKMKAKCHQHNLYCVINEFDDHWLYRHWLPKRKMKAMCSGGYDFMVIMPNGDLYRCLGHACSGTNCMGNLSCEDPKKLFFDDNKICTDCFCTFFTQCDAVKIQIIEGTKEWEKWKPGRHTTGFPALTEDKKKQVKASSEYWSRKNNFVFHQSIKQIMQDIETRIPFGGMHNWLANVLNGKTLNEGVSIGCGNGSKEVTLLKKGFIERIYGYEISAKRIEECNKRASDNNLADRFFVNYNEGLLPSDGKKYDLVYWDNALHHMENTEEAIKWSYESLNDNGILYIDDYVGTNRMQWTDKELEIANSMRKEMPEEWFINSNSSEWYDKRILPRPPLYHYVVEDPTEAKDSENIIPSIKKYFYNPRIVLTGGICYFVAMTGLYQFINAERDKEVIKYLLEKDRQFTKDGYTSYAVCITRKN